MARFINETGEERAFIARERKLTPEEEED